MWMVSGHRKPWHRKTASAQGSLPRRWQTPSLEVSHVLQPEPEALGDSGKENSLGPAQLLPWAPSRNPLFSISSSGVRGNRLCQPQTFPCLQRFPQALSAQHPKD